MKISGFASLGGVLIAINVPAASAFQNIRPLAPRDVQFRKVFAAVVSIDEDAPRELGAMDQWATACGVQKAEGFQLAMSEDGMDCSVMTTKDLQENQPILMVPSVMVLTGAKAREELGIAKEAEDLLLNRIGSSVDATEYLPQFYLFLKVLKEYEMGDQSPWYPWLNSLPRYFSNGSAMTPFCTACLPPLVGKLTDTERIRYIQYFRALEDVDLLSDGTKKDRDLAKWAFSVVCTRSFPTGDGDVRISPMADMFNHGTETEVEITSDEEGNCFAYVTKDVPAGSPLRVQYADPTNPSYLFARYGFVDETSPATFCKIMISHPSQELKDMGYDYSRMLFYKDTGDVSEEVWDVLLYQLLGEANPNDQQAFYQAHMNGDYETKRSIHEYYFSQTSDALRNHVDTFLDELDGLTKKTRGKNLSIHPRLPLLLKHNEFVKRTFLKVKAQLLEYA